MNKFYYILIFLVTLVNAQDNKEKEYFLVPYEAEGKWGLADTLGNVKVNPVYDDIIDCAIVVGHPKSFYLFRQQKKNILIDQTGEAYLQEYDSIGASKNLGSSLVRRGYIYKNGKTGVYNFSTEKIVNSVSVIIEPIYDRIEFVNDKYIVTLNDKKGLIEFKDGKINTCLGIKYDKIEYDKKAYRGVVDGKSTIYETPTSKYPSPTGSLDRREQTQIAEEQKLKERQKLKSHIENIERDLDKEELKKISPIETSRFKNYIKYRDNGKYGYVDYQYYMQDNQQKLIKKIVVPIEFDSISEINQSTYLVKKDSKYGIVQGGKYRLEPIYDGIFYYPVGSQNEVILKKERKFAVYDVVFGKMKSEFTYDDFQYIAREGYGHFLMLIIGKKKGVWNGKTAVAEFDDIVIERKTLADFFRTFTSDFIKYKKNKMWGVVKIDNPTQVVVPFEFDDIIQNNWKFYITVKNGLYGAYGTGGINITPKYTSIKLFKAISHKGFFLIFEGIDKTGKKVLLDKKGKEFRK